MDYDYDSDSLELELKKSLIKKCELCLFAPDPTKIEDLTMFIKESKLPNKLIHSHFKQLIFTINSIIFDEIPKLTSKSYSSADDLFCKCFKLYNIILQKVSIQDAKYFEILFRVFCLLIDQHVKYISHSQSPFSEISTELLIECTSNLFISFDQRMFISFIFNNNEIAKFEMMLGLMSSCLLRIAVEHKYQLLKRSSLNLISKIYLKMVNSSFENFNYGKIVISKQNDENLKRSSKYIAFILPGTLSKLWKLLNQCSNENYHKLHFEVIIDALKLLNILCQIVFHEGQSFKDKDSTNDKDALIESINESWFEKISKNLSLILISIFDTLIEHPNQDVRLNLFKCSTSLIFNCCEPFVFRFLDILLKVPLNYLGNTSYGPIFITYQPERNEMKNYCQQFKKTFYREILSKSLDQITLTNLFHKEIFNHFQQMPYLFRNINVNNMKKIVTKSDLRRSFQILIGYLYLLNQSGLYDFLKLEQHTNHLFRTLINIGEFDFKSSKYSKIDFELEDDSLSIGDKTNQTELIWHMFDLFHFEKHLLYLNDLDLLRRYLSLINHLCICSDFRTFQIIIDHLSHLLEYSDFEPTVILIVNTFLTSVRELDYKAELEIYFRELISDYLKNLHTNDIYVGEDWVHKNIEQEDKFLTLLSLSTICSQTEDTNKSNEIEKDSKRLYHRKIFQHCLAMKGLVLLYSLFDADQIRSEFYQTLFIQLVQSMGSQHKLVCRVSKFCLIFIGQHLDPKLMETCHETRFLINRMVLDNLDYVYSSFSIGLDYSVIQQNSINRKYLSYLYVYDFYSIKTIQNSLLTIIELMSEYHKSNVESFISSSQMEYLNRLVDQILNLIKYYSIRSVDIEPDDLNRLLEVLYAYEQLVSLVYDDQQFVPSLNHRLELREIKESITKMIEELENFVETCLSMNRELNNSNLQDHDSAFFNDSSPSPLSKENDRLEDSNILKSPIIQSRIGNILYLCPMLLSDQNITIRLNVLQISSISIRLLRSYEDILLPYVHHLWDSLVKRFSLDSEHAPVMKRAFDCLMLTSELCGDFILQRTRKEVLPSLLTFLQGRFDRRIIYYRQHRRNETIKSVDYYAEIELLQSLGQLAVNIKLSSQDIWNMLPVLILYICSKGIMEDLQKCSLQSLITLADKTDQYSVRFYVHLFLEVFYQDQLKSLNHPKKNYLDSKFKCDCSWRRNQFSDVVKKHSDLFLKLDCSNLLTDLISHLNV